MIRTTTELIAGREITEVLGVVKGSTVRTKNVLRDLTAGLKNIVGGELKGYTEMLNEAREESSDRMTAEAQSLGADANETLNKSYTEAQRLGKTAFKTGLKWTEDFINMMIDLSLEMTGESKITDTPWQELSPQLNKKLV